MFRRSKSEATDASTATDPAAKPGGKGRPTPTRREAEAAAKARAKTPRTRKEMAAQQRLARSESSRKMREAMRTGDDRYLPARDQGPVKRFVRDYVDTRWSFMELILPLMLITLVLGYSGNVHAAALGNTILLAAMALFIVNAVLLSWKLRRELARRFPDAPTRGTTWYAVVRSFQMKFMRMPKAQYKIGQELPEHYR